MLASFLERDRLAHAARSSGSGRLRSMVAPAWSSDAVGGADGEALDQIFAVELLKVK
jgi:hypothetical protein